MRVWMVAEYIGGDWDSGGYEDLDSATVFDNEEAALEFKAASGRCSIYSYCVHSDTSGMREVWSGRRGGLGRKVDSVEFLRWDDRIEPSSPYSAEVFAVDKKTAREAANSKLAEWDRTEGSK